MPSSTFLNLPNSKRERILNRCFVEFTNHTYQVASVSRIVDDLGISKGSIYKYFTNKKDLYMYLIDIAATSKLTYLANSINNDNNSFFDNLWAVIKTGVDFDLKFKQYSLFIGRVSSDTDALIETPVSQQLVDTSAAFIKGMVLKAQSLGEIRSDMNADSITYLINTTLVNYPGMLAKKHRLSISELLVSVANSSGALSKDLVLNELKGMIEMIKQGISKK